MARESFAETFLIGKSTSSGQPVMSGKYLMSVINDEAIQYILP